MPSTPASTPPTAWQRARGATKSTLNTLAAIATLVGVPFGAVQIQQAKDAAQRSDLSYVFTGSINAQVSGNVKTGQRDVTLHNAGIITNRGRMPITIVGFSYKDAGKPSLKFASQPLVSIDQSSTIGHSRPFSLQPGEGAVVSVCVPGNTTPGQLDAVLSDGQTLSLATHNRAIEPPEAVGKARDGLLNKACE